jgi:hypothetical protein
MPISAEDRAKQKQLQGELGERCAFFDSPVGLIAVAPPEQAAEAYWKLRRDLENPHLDGTGVTNKFVVDCVAYPDKNVVAACLRTRPALGLRMGRACRKLLGEGLQEDPSLDEEDKPGEVATLAELQEKHGGEVHWYMVPDFGLVVLAPPKSPAAYRQFANTLNKEDANEAEVWTNFALDCVVHPSREMVAELLLLQPGLARAFGKSGDGLCGGDFEELGKV